MPNESVAFDRAADYYDNTRGFPPGVERDVAALVARVGNLDKNSRVLEIGIGTGRIALPVAPYTGAYFGIDLALPMLARLRAKQTSEPVYPVLGDATRLPFPDDAFDAVIAVHVFHLIPGWRDVLRELVRVLRPGAPLLHGWNLRQMGDSLMNVWNKVTEDPGETPAGISESARDTFLVDHGWRETGAAETHHFTIQRTPQDFYQRMENRSYSRTWRMTDEQIERGLAALRVYMQATYADPNQLQTLDSGFTVQAYLPPLENA